MFISLMKKNIHIFPLSIIVSFICLTTAQYSSLSSNAAAVADSQATYTKNKYQRQFIPYKEEFGSESGESVTIESIPLTFDNPRLKIAYTALQAWKRAIISDPLQFTSNWVGADVCNYAGVFCYAAPDNESIQTVAGIDLNRGDIAGRLVEELGRLSDIAFFHINSNRFCGRIPRTFQKLKLLYEVDISNNHFAGKFPSVLLDMPDLKYLDIRFNEFEGNLPKKLFDKQLDAIFINHNRFSSKIPDNLGNSPVSVIVLANNKFHGCLPESFRNMSETLNELIIMNNGLHSCLPKDIGLFKNVTVFDASYNKLVGSLPVTIGEMKSLEQLNLAHNMITGTIPESICLLSNIKNFNFSYNFITGEPPECLDLEDFDDSRNCLRGRPKQRSRLQCKMVLSKHFECTVINCHNSSPSPPHAPPLPPPAWPSPKTPPPQSAPPPPSPYINSPPPPSTYPLPPPPLLPQ